MEKNVEDFLKRQQHSTCCYICDVQLPDDKTAMTHYSSKCHKNNVKTFRMKALEILQKNETTEVLKKVEKSPKVNKKETLHCKICNVRFGEEAANGHYKGEEHKKKAEAYCEICSILTMSKEQLWKHMFGSKHKKKLENLKLPAIDVQYGPSDQSLPGNLRKMMVADTCKVCQLKFPTIKHALDHYRGSKHKTRIELWLKDRTQDEKQHSPDKTKKNVTENIKDTVKQKSETSTPKKSHLYCKICDIQNATLELLELHKTTNLHKENLNKSNNNIEKGALQKLHMPSLENISNTEEKVPKKRDDVQINITSRDLKLPSSLSDFDDGLGKINPSSKEQVFQELEKLIQTLYYSKTVPYDIALEYLKKFNKEIELLKKKYEKTESKNVSEMSASSSNFGEDNTKTNETESKILNDEDEFYSLSSEYNLSRETHPSFDLIDCCDDVPATKLQEVESTLKKSENDFSLTKRISEGCDEAVYGSDQNSSKVSEENTNTDQVFNKKIDHLIQKEHIISFDDDDNLDNMLKKIILLKKKVEEKYPNEYNVEKEVLVELETLINLMNSDDLSLDVKVFYLQKFNKEIDPLSSTGPERQEEIETKLPLNDACAALQAKQQVKYRYSREELLSLRPDRTAPERLDIKLRLNITESRIWNKHYNHLNPPK